MEPSFEKRLVVGKGISEAVYSTHQKIPIGAARQFAVAGADKVARPGLYRAGVCFGELEALVVFGVCGTRRRDEVRVF